MEEELSHIDCQISSHEAGTLLESVPAPGVKSFQLLNPPHELKH